MANEIELKLEVRPTQLRKLAVAPWLVRFASGPAETHRLESVYYDTDELALRAQRAILRVRKNGDAYTQTFKSESRAAHAGLGRLEWECPLDDAKPYLKHARKKKTGGVALKKLAGALKPVFETNVERKTLALHYQGSQVELALDRGEIKTGRRRTPIHEVELELKKGDPASVVMLGRQIAKKLKATYGVASKAERGYVLREGESESPVCAEPIVRAPDMNAGQAFQAIAMTCVHHFAGNRKAVLAGRPEGIHQMRVGLRRLRAAISVFKEMLRGPETEQVKTELKWLTEELGPARDMDVMAKDAVAPLDETSPAPKALVALKADVLAKRDKGFARAKRAVTSERYRRVVLDTVLWINGGKWTQTGVALIVGRRKLPAPRFATQELDRRTAKVLKKLGKLNDLSPLKRHKLRIAVKKLRYATGYFEGLFGGERAIKAFSGVLEDLQSSLGQLNDIRVHGGLAQDYAAPARGTRRAARQAFAMGELSGKEHAKTRKLLTATKRRGKRLKRCPVFWK
jgi:inorganic triphosphatase YgiF